jgi:hypothetical protein
MFAEDRWLAPILRQHSGRRSKTSQPLKRAVKQITLIFQALNHMGLIPIQVALNPCQSLFRWTRVPCKSFSDQRNCHTASPSLRLTNTRLTCCILSLRDRSCGARGFSRITGNQGRRVSGHLGELLCVGNAPYKTLISHKPVSG